MFSSFVKSNKIVEKLFLSLKQYSNLQFDLSGFYGRRQITDLKEKGKIHIKICI